MEQSIPIRLKEARKRLNLNQIQIAQDLNIQQKSISDIENGKILNIPNTYIYYFYKKGVSLEWIYDNKGPMLLSETKQSNSTSNKTEQSFSDFFQETIKFPSQENNLTDIRNIRNDSINKLPEPNELYERIIDSKDFTIKSLLAYINSLENGTVYLKDFLNKVISDQSYNRKGNK